MQIPYFILFFAHWVEYIKSYPYLLLYANLDFFHRVLNDEITLMRSFGVCYEVQTKNKMEQEQILYLFPSLGGYGMNIISDFFWIKKNHQHTCILQLQNKKDFACLAFEWLQQVFRTLFLVWFVSLL